eukprot:TRINITY_DN94070_c0_g1_i1.p1 TRINITY_DN94070_c0_g1~~TRINITY_DN94070_c0_g1_i1.p1  ORF type:complete len:448 (+),score=67.73 TRINITY_DN94070_c0_g1_i1:118-1461(+)
MFLRRVLRPSIAQTFLANHSLVHYRVACAGSRSVTEERRSQNSYAESTAEPGAAVPTTKASTEKVPPSPANEEPWHSFSPKGLAAVNLAGNLCALAASSTHDHITVRLLSAMSSTLVTVFNVCMPKPLKTHQKTAASWGFAFALLHSINLVILLREKHTGVQLSDEEEDIYEHAFQKHGVTPRQFTTLLGAGGKFHDYGPGETLAEMDKPVDKIIYIVHGNCFAEKPGGVSVLEYHQDVFVGNLQPQRWRAEYLGSSELLAVTEESPAQGDLEDSWLIERAQASASRTKGRTSSMRQILTQGLSEKVGRLTPLCVGSTWGSTVRAGQGGCRVLVWPLGSFTCAVGADEALCKAMEQIDEMGLASKISAGSGRKALEGYKELLSVVIADGRIDPEEKCALHRYRARHAVPDAEHFRILAELGWSQVEYELGILKTRYDRSIFTKSLLK